MKNISELKNQIETLHASGHTVDEIEEIFDLPYDTHNLISPINQNLHLSREEADLIAYLKELRKQEEMDPATLAQYLPLRSRFVQITAQEKITDREELVELMRRAGELLP